MDPSEFRAALDGVACTACGASVPVDRIRLLARRDGVTIIGAR